jgi:hypothetical protein
LPWQLPATLQVRGLARLFSCCRLQDVTFIPSKSSLPGVLPCCFTFFSGDGMRPVRWCGGGCVDRHFIPVSALLSPSHCMLCRALDIPAGYVLLALPRSCL